MHPINATTSSNPSSMLQDFRRVLLISENFPPSAIASVHRARHLAKHLSEFGWRPTVLAVDHKFHKEPADFELAQLVPANVEIEHVPAWPVRPLDRLGVGDLALRAYPFVRAGLQRILSASQYDAVFITGWPYYQMLMTSWIKKRWDIPVVLDFQDPWVSADGARQTRWSKAGITHSLSVALEPKAVRHASWITSVSDKQNAELADRYPWFDRTRMSAIPIGGDPEDFIALRQTPPAHPTVRLDPNKINLCYVGTFLPRAGPVVKAVFDAAAMLQRDQPRLAERLQFVFVGTSNQSVSVTTPISHCVTPIAAAAGVGHLVSEHVTRVPFLEALGLLANAHGLLLLGSDEAHYTASKIYPALMSGRPYLSVFHAQSSSHEILTRANGGATYAFSEPDQLADLTPQIAAGLARLIERPESFSPADPAAYAPYTARAVSERFAAIFDKIAK